MTHTTKDWLHQATRQLAPLLGDRASFEARVLWAHAASLDDAAVWLTMDREADPAVIAKADSCLARRLQHEPMAYIVGEREFWSLSLKVTPATLIPRPDSESLIETMLWWRKKTGVKPRHLLDLGTGSGCLLLALLSEWQDVRGVGIDHSSAAIDVAKCNAMRLSLDFRADFLVQSWETYQPEDFHVIIGNPPYIPTDRWRELEPTVRDFEPRGALDGGGDGLDAYRSLWEVVRRWSGKKNVVLCLESGTDQVQYLEDQARAWGWWSHVWYDMTSRPRGVIMGFSSDEDPGEILQPLGLDAKRCV
jgi:release factor glutamine methyltransferase